MTVVAMARRVDRLDAMAAEHPHIVAHGADVADRGAVDGLAERVREQFGCHLLVTTPVSVGERSGIRERR
jgi:NADP-dependent 3-hydroxy acid dehydrogenase YdfG